MCEQKKSSYPQNSIFSIRSQFSEESLTPELCSQLGEFCISLFQRFLQRQPFSVPHFLLRGNKSVNINSNIWWAPRRLKTKETEFEWPHLEKLRPCHSSHWFGGELIKLMRKTTHWLDLSLPLCSDTSKAVTLGGQSMSQKNTASQKKIPLNRIILPSWSWRLSGSAYHGDEIQIKKKGTRHLKEKSS